MEMMRTTDIVFPPKAQVQGEKNNTFTKGGSGDPSVLLDPDYVWKIDSNLRLLIEVKPHWSFPSGCNLAEQYLVDIQNSNDSKVIRAVQQGDLNDPHLDPLTLISLRLLFLQFIEIFLLEYAA